MTSRLRVMAGRVSAVGSGTVTIDLATDPDTGETLAIDVPLAPAPGLGGPAYASIGPDGAVVLGDPYGTTGRGVWTYAGTVVTSDPGSGGLAINGSGGSPRTFAVSKTDADGWTRNLVIVAPGDNVTVTDDPSSPPITGFARYVVTGVPVDEGTYVTFTATRTDTSGTQSPPPIGTRLRVSAAAGSGGGGGGPYDVVFPTYQALLDGIVIGG